MTNDNANLEVIPASLDLTQNPRPNKKRRDADNQDFNFVDSGKIHYNKKSFQYYLQSVMTVRTHARVSKKSWLVSANGLRDTLEVVVVKRTINIKSTVPLNSTESLRRHFHAQNKENAYFKVHCQQILNMKLTHFCVESCTKKCFKLSTRFYIWLTYETRLWLFVQNYNKFSF